jgi:predicted kinase
MAIFNSALKNRENIVVDNTNPTIETRQQYILPAKQAGYSITILYFVKAGHNYNDKRVNKVPQLVYHRFYKLLQPPTEEEGKVYLVW